MAAAVVITESGAVKGARHSDVHAYRGIPFAAPAGGEGRFRPPKRAEPWDGVRDATVPGPVSWQVSGASLPEPLRSIKRLPTEQICDEDCLSLNVWTPDPSAAANLPVLVHVHGGGMTVGAGSWPHFDGAHLARRGAVVVTMNYRLGLLGGLHLAEHLGPEFAASGNGALLDQLCAIEWVRRNVAAFGGDPDALLAYGSSAGAQCIGALLAMPAATGTFRAAGLMSGAHLPLRTRDEAVDVTRRVLRELDVPEAEAVKVLDVPAPRLLAAQHAVQARWPSTVYPWAPVVDGLTVPVAPAEAVISGRTADVPAVVGTCLDETALLTWSSRPRCVDDEAVADLLGGGTGAGTAAAVARYRQAAPGARPVDLYVRITSDRWRLGALDWADRRAARGSSPTWVYRFDRRSPVAGGELGASHGFELPYFFDNVGDDPQVGPEPDESLAAAMSDALLALARHGDPNHSGLPSWPAWDPDRPSSMIFDSPPRIESDAGSVERRLQGERSG